MKSFIKNLLTEALTEIFYLKHSNDRIKERISVFSDDDITPNTKNIILNNINLLGDINLSPNKSYGILLGSFAPNKKSQHYIDVNGRGYYQINDDAVIHDSTGDQIWAVVRDNQVTTVMLRKSIQTANDEHNKEKLMVDEIIRNLPKYVERLNAVKQTPGKEKFKKIKLNNGEVVRYYEQSNEFETLNGDKIDVNVIFDDLPEDLQNKVIELSENSKLNK